MKCLPSQRRVVVLDIETLPCPDSLSQAHAKSRGGYARPALHKVICASVLTADERVSGYHDLDIRTFDEGMIDEAGLIGFVDLLLPDPSDDRSRLVTFNGARSDLAILKHRACANWLFAVPSLSGWCEGRGDHVDLMQVGFGSLDDRWSLSDICAGFGLAIRGGLLGRSVAQLHGTGRLDAVREHNRLDVVGTFLAYAYHRSFQAANNRFVASAWDQVAKLLDGVPSVNLEAVRLSRHHLVSLARDHLRTQSDPELY